MKNFIASFFGALAALLVFICGSFMLAALVMAGIAVLSQKKPVTVPAGAYLVVDLSANIQEAPDQMDGLTNLLDAMGGADGAGRRLQLREVTRALRAAATDRDIAGVYVVGNLMPLNYGSGYAALKEVRGALAAVKAAGKPVKAYLKQATTRDYYVASAASEVVMDPFGVILMPGLAAQPLFFAGAFEKFGLGVQVTRVGKYKSAVEPFTRKDMSPENRAQTQKLLDDVWSELTTDIETSRKLPPGTLQKIVEAEGLLRAGAALAGKLVDRVAYVDEVLQELKLKTGRTDNKEAFKQIALADYAKLVSGHGALPQRRSRGGAERRVSDGKIAIVYAEGDIIDGEGHLGEVGGARFARELRRLRLDDSVKAIVLRVNSPGGSATASEDIQREMRLAMKTKPVVVSMGTVAASGGFWISTYADHIFAEPATITGSIGVFGLFVNVQDLANNKLGVTSDTVKTGKFADAFTLMRPKTTEELVIFQGIVDWVYDQFVGKIAESRKLAPAVVREIAQGRVWSGLEAKNLGLVDEIGGLEEAMKFAAIKAKLSDNYRVEEFPRRKELLQVLSEALGGRRPGQARSGPLGQMWSEVEGTFDWLHRLNDPKGVYARLPFEVRLN
ncbi:MAG: signal peptide peptidase SppA [Opitutaceae bacterium]|nr:signal peptide peptidase SppA [Opitutaceae bacterium]